MYIKALCCRDLKKQADGGRHLKPHYQDAATHIEADDEGRVRIGDERHTILRRVYIHQSLHHLSTYLPTYLPTYL